jgi:hypothetical protein
MTLPTTRNAVVLLAAIAAVACAAGRETRSAPRLRTTGAAPSGIAMSSLQLSQPVVEAGERVTATVTLTEPARSPSGAVIVYVGFDSESLAGPREVRIPNGQTSATFTLYSKPSLRAARSAAISACTSSPEPYGLLTRTVSITPRDVRPTAAALVASSR